MDTLLIRSRPSGSSASACACGCTRSWARGSPTFSARGRRLPFIGTCCTAPSPAWARPRFSASFRPTSRTSRRRAPRPCGSAASTRPSRAVPPSASSTARCSRQGRPNRSVGVGRTCSRRSRWRRAPSSSPGCPNPTRSAGGAPSWWAHAPVCSAIYPRSDPWSLATVCMPTAPFRRTARSRRRPSSRRTSRNRGCRCPPSPCQRRTPPRATNPTQRSVATPSTRPVWAEACARALATSARASAARMASTRCSTSSAGCSPRQCTCCSCSDTRRRRPR